MEPEKENLEIEMLKVVRHDFKTPLTSLRMLAQMFQLGVDKGTLSAQPERVSRHCQMMVDQVDKLVELADKLSDVSLAQSGRLKLKTQAADLRPVIEAAVSRFEGRIDDVDLPENPVWGEWDVGRLRQSLIYLLSEAVSANVALKVDGDKAHIVLKGDFHDIKEDTNAGVYVARTVAEKHGGELRDRFEIVLPLKKSA